MSIEIQAIVDQATKDAKAVEKASTNASVEHQPAQSLQKIAAELTLIRTELAGIRVAISTQQPTFRPK